MQNKLFFYVYLQQTAVSLEIDQKQHRIMNIELLGGTSSRLYKLVAPLVMSAAVLRQNNNYPYKTSVRHEWLVALEDDGKTVKGFFPIERRDGYAYINNYYVSAETEEELLDAFIDKALTLYAPTCPLVACCSFSPHRNISRKRFFDRTGVEALCENEIHEKQWDGVVTYMRQHFPV